jgi:uncharacterized membrane protein (DUF4010 family)
MIDPELLTGLLTALGLGLLIGVVRERRHQPDTATAGTRTHALVAILGYVSWEFGVWPFVATVLVIGALVIGGYRLSAATDPGQTGEVALLLTLMLAALAHQNAPLSAGLGVLAAMLLYAKAASQHISRVLITERELQDALILAAAALVVLPLLSNHPIDPWGVLQPKTLWRIVVLILAVGMFGHIAQRALGERWGVPVAGFFSGFVSSTAVVASMGQRVRSGQSHTMPAAASALLANLASLILFAGVIGAVSPKLLVTMTWPLVLAGLGLMLVVLPGLRRIERDGVDARDGRAFTLKHALVITSIIAAMSLLATGLQHLWGETGVLIAALCLAWVEVHASAASVAQLMQSGDMTPRFTQWVLIAILGSSALAKTMLAIASGGFRYGVTVGAGLLALVAGSAAGLWMTM